jgi:LysM repeat protein
MRRLIPSLILVALCLAWLPSTQAQSSDVAITSNPFFVIFSQADFDLQSYVVDTATSQGQFVAHYPAAEVARFIQLNQGASEGFPALYRQDSNAFGTVRVSYVGNLRFRAELWRGGFAVATDTFTVNPIFNVAGAGAVAGSVPAAPPAPGSSTGALTTVSTNISTTAPNASITTTTVVNTGTAVVASRTYVVQRGDTLYRIARRYGVTWQTLAALNGLANPNVIHVGQVLRVP